MDVDGEAAVRALEARVARGVTLELHRRLIRQRLGFQPLSFVFFGLQPGLTLLYQQVHGIRVVHIHAVQVMLTVADVQTVRVTAAARPALVLILLNQVL